MFVYFECGRLCVYSGGVDGLLMRCFFLNFSFYYVLVLEVDLNEVGCFSRDCMGFGIG